MAEPFTFTDDEGNVHTFVPVAQGVAKLANSADIARDELGYTNPNLHRRIDCDISETNRPTEYSLLVGNVNSYRTTRVTLHDEDSTTTEVP